MESHSWWAMIVLLLASASVFASLAASYYFLWTVSPGVWPAHAGHSLPAWTWPAASALLLAISAGLIALASKSLHHGPRHGPWPVRLAIVAGLLALVAATGIELYGHWRTGLRPQESSYAAVVYTLVALQGFFVAVTLVMGLYTLARSLAGLISHERRITFDNTRLMWYYTAGQGLVALAIAHLSPRLLG
jgi:cytochrome c oxidase subunit I+III